MDFYYDEYEESINKKNKPTIKWLIVFLVGIIILLLMILLARNSNPSRKYHKMEEKIISKAEDYIYDKGISISHEVFLDVSKIDFKLEEGCYNTSGVFYNGEDFIPYLYCDNYESKIVNNNTSGITLLGKEVTVIAQGIQYFDSGYIGNNVEVSGEVGTEEGVYNINYIDKANGNMLTRKVVVINNKELFNQFPMINLNGDAIVNVIQNENYVDSGASAYDNLDGEISDKIVLSGNVDTQKIGEYKLTYSITNTKGYINSITRMVNVISKNIDFDIKYLIVPETNVSSNVTIVIRVYGDNYAYTILPNGEKKNDSYITFEVSKNGIYTFKIYDANGRFKEQEIEIKNIDKTPPTAVCSIVKYDGYVNFIVNKTNDKTISSYTYQANNKSLGESISSTYRYSSTDIQTGKVIIKDSVGNENTISCEIQNYKDWNIDFSKSLVYIKSDNNILKGNYTLEDYLKGSLYAFIKDIDLSNYSLNQMKELFQAYFVIKKGEIFNSGGYSYVSKELILKESDVNYCDIHTGCGKTSGLNDDMLKIVNMAYEKTIKEIIISNNYNDLLLRYPFISITSINNYKNELLNDVLANSDYSKIINKYYSNFKIYNIDNYISKYDDVMKSKTIYWWPIGSISADTSGLYSGMPTSIDVIHNYGGSINDKKIYNGMDIKGECGVTNVISSWDGKVLQIGSDSNKGNYVMVDYGNGITFLYGSLEKSSITVRIGDSLRKGQLIGRVGKTNTCMLHLETYLNNRNVDPREYISSEELRSLPKSNNGIVYVEGGTVKRSVCLSLLASGFSREATAAILSNIERESGFNLRSVGDDGSSFGLIQWHKGRGVNFRNFCKGRDTIDSDYTACQLEFMLYELKSTHKKVYPYILGNYSAYEIGYEFCYIYEAPAAKETSCAPRGQNAQTKYMPYVNNGCN